ncbi:DUF885 domain-containing protein [Allostreptomyces psammosilenae]|uniref:Uncharacterized protein (DUF885 family) n=1 Tax=Allostreptomyces psammosilenae TaxID=1892865 RepID=A0A852ZSM9_9ACTN|nr:DUF885 domain-containing protein [Allostreptomyces psammosilenae]NYI04835.1 uncharacterized protein (DUF885 family) [Allostreptomyces psammosilenae]
MADTTSHQPRPSHRPDHDGTDRVDRKTPRALADAYLDAYGELDPIAATHYGTRPGDHRLPDLSPAGQEAVAALQRATLTRLAELERDTAPAADPADAEATAERRCARLLRERLTAALAVHDAGEGLRRLGNLGSPLHRIRDVFTLMPTDTPEDWSVVAARMRHVPGALDGYRASLAEGLARDLPAGPRQVATVVDQLGEWLGETGGDGRDWFTALVDAGPPRPRDDLTAAAGRAAAAVADLRDWLRDRYAPAVAGAPDVVGADRYALWARQHTGADLDLAEAYAWGWEEFHRIAAEMCAEADRVLPGAGTPATLHHLRTSGTAIDGVPAVRAWLQRLTEEAIDALDGVHFDLAAPLHRVETLIAPPGTAAAPYYASPPLDFSRPGRIYLPTMGLQRFPIWDLVSTWYHEGVPGHHLQLAQWVLVADRLSRYQVTVGMVSANVEGWALYAERLMDELGFLTDPERRLGYLDAQMLRALRVILDIGMHLALPIPAGSGFHEGERWTPALAREFFGRHCGLPPDYLDSELVRYLGLPGQAIGYKLGERAWLRGRERARRAHGAAFDLRAWHMAALSSGSLGLDDLEDELAAR